MKLLLESTSLPFSNTKTRESAVVKLLESLPKKLMFQASKQWNLHMTPSKPRNVQKHNSLDEIVKEEELAQTAQLSSQELMIKQIKQNHIVKECARK
jgi:hypothetical protein